MRLGILHESGVGHFQGLLSLRAVGDGQSQTAVQEVVLRQCTDTDGSRRPKEGPRITRPLLAALSKRPMCKQVVEQGPSREPQPTEERKAYLVRRGFASLLQAAKGDARHMIADLEMQSSEWNRELHWVKLSPFGAPKRLVPF